MPFYSDRTDEGPLDFPVCPNCHEPVYSEAGCLDCMTAVVPTRPLCEVDWAGCNPDNVPDASYYHECEFSEGHEGPHRCWFCGATSGEVAA